jgi:hypothetical protein
MRAFSRFNPFNRPAKNTTQEDTNMTNENKEDNVVNLDGEKFEGTTASTEETTNTTEENTMNNETNNTADAIADEPKKSKFGKTTKIVLGAVGIGALAGAGYLIARAMSSSDNAVVAAVGEAVETGADAVAEVTGELVGETVAAMFG